MRGISRSRESYKVTWLSFLSAEAQSSKTITHLDGEFPQQDPVLRAISARGQVCSTSQIGCFDVKYIAAVFCFMRIQPDSTKGGRLLESWSF